MPFWSGVVLPVGEAAGEATADAVSPGAEGRADTEAEADGAVLAPCALTVVRSGGTVTTTGAAATAIAAGLVVAQGPVPVAPHPAAVVRELATLAADDGPGENMP